MAKRTAGISGVALLITAAGAWLMFVGVRDVPPVEGLRELLRGNVPSGRATTQSFRGTSGLAGIGKAANAAGRLTSVAGIRVDESIADAVSQLVTGARPNLLTGSGYRTREDQARLRREHCCNNPNSSTCSCGPPTAPVGESMHEKGLAVDFSWNAQLIRSRKSPGFLYLQAHAPGLGLQNLPSEPWHWSTNGK